MKHSLTVRKAIAASLGILIFLSQDVFSSAVEVNFWNERHRPTAVSISQQFQLPSVFPILRGKENVEPLRTPSRDNTPQRRTVIYINDIHANVEAQKSISQALLRFTAQKQVKLVALEGAFGQINLQRFKSFKDQTSLHRAATESLEKNKISGPIHAALISSLPAVVGVDDQLHYHNNVSAFRQAKRYQERLRRYLLRQSRILQIRKKHFFSRSLSHFDKQVEAYRTGHLTLGTYVRCLMPEARFFPNLQSFSAAFEIERTLNFDAVERERLALISRLEKKLRPDESKTLVEYALAFREGRLRLADFYTALNRMFEANHVDLAPYPAMRKYLRYVVMADRIDGTQLFNELTLAENRKFSSLIKNEKEKTLIERSRRLQLMNKLIDFSLTQNEWSEYKSTPALSLPTFRVSQLARFESFYREAEVRDHALAENLLNQMNEKQVTTAVLVAGGFHSSGVCERLRRAGVSVVAFVPKVTYAKKEKGTVYLEAFAREKAPLDKLFDGSRLFLAPEPWTPTVEFGLAEETAELAVVADPSLSVSNVIRSLCSSIQNTFVLMFHIQGRLFVLLWKPVRNIYFRFGHFEASTLSTGPDDSAVVAENDSPHFVLDPLFRPLLIGKSFGLFAFYVGVILLLVVPMAETWVFQSVGLNPLSDTRFTLESSFHLIERITILGILFGISHAVTKFVADQYIWKEIAAYSQVRDFFISKSFVGLAFGVFYVGVLLISGPSIAFAATAVVHSLSQRRAILEAYKLHAKTSDASNFFIREMIPWFQVKFEDSMSLFLRFKNRTQFLWRFSAKISRSITTLVVLVLLFLGVPEGAWSYTRVPARPSVEFLGGAAEIGATSNLVRIGNKKVLVDVGYSIGAPDPLPRLDRIPPDLDAIFLTHAHTDHVGSLPLIHKMFREKGRNLPIYATPETVRLLHIVLNMQVRSLEEYNVSRADIAETLQYLTPLNFGERRRIGDDAWVEFHRAGHLRGAASVELGSISGKALVTGDLHLQSQFTVGAANPTAFRPDITVVESTYGGSNRIDRKAQVELMKATFSAALAEGKNIVIPVLGVGRAQEVLEILVDAKRERKIPMDVDINFDGVIGTINDLFDLQYEPSFNLYDLEANAGRRAALMRWLKKGTAKPSITLATSGMLHPGTKIIDYLAATLPHANTLVAFVNYQPENELGRKIQEAAKGDTVQLPIRGTNNQRITLQADVKNFQLSGHASGEEIEGYLKSIQARRSGVAIVHGTGSNPSDLANRLGMRRFQAVVPKIGDRVVAPPILFFRALVQMFILIFRTPPQLSIPTMQISGEETKLVTPVDVVNGVLSGSELNQHIEDIDGNIQESLPDNETSMLMLISETGKEKILTQIGLWANSERKPKALLIIAASGNIGSEVQASLDRFKISGKN